MSLYTELSEGDSDSRLLIDTLQRLAGQVARVRGFPPPEGHDRWDDAAAIDLVTELYAAKPNFVTMCWARANDDASLERLFVTTIRNFLIDQAKGTETGKLRRRLHGLVSKDVTLTFGKFPTGEDAWWLADNDGAPWHGDLAELERAAGRVQGTLVTTLNPAGPTPAETVKSLMRVVHAVLEAAAGAVRAQDVTRVVERRLGLSTLPVSRSLFPDDPVQHDAAIPVAGADSELDTEAAAEAIWETLQDVERSVCCNLLLPDEDLEKFLGKGPLETAEFKQWLYAKMRLGCEDSRDAEAVVLRVISMCAERP